MTTPPAPSVINPDIPPPPRPDTSAPSGDRPLSPTNTAGAPNKRSRIVSDDAMNVDITSPSAPAPNLTHTVPSGLPVNRVPVITQPPPTNFRREHVTILTGIPKNIKEADLLEIATQVNAKALNVSLSINSYKPKPYVHLNFSSFDTFEAAKELSVAFCNKCLTWHLPNEVHTLCHVCGRSGCVPSDSCQSRDKSTSRLRLRSTSRSRNNSSSSRSNNNNNNINTSRPNVPNHNNQSSNNNTNSRNNANSSGSTQYPHTLHPNNTTSTSLNNNPNCTLPQHIIDELKAQIEKIANTLNILDETVS
ncbi:hypothetical protein RhiirC2_772633 [Rhizophagus irregularis]|uniref:RRM domain-containing protein n=1 Tax=Rhizophagus irregularis TaxID=588596 RepID=A0A2N1NR33_9GLOM|nr:hypothetical protein RhiirC2_772633 [Rhizophagus irregularis]